MNQQEKNNPFGQSARVAEISQAGMDKKVKRVRPFWKKPIIAGPSAVALLALAWFVLLPEGGRTLRISSQSITVSTVSQGQFDDFIPVRGRVTPLKTIYLDAVEGGRVDNISVEDGAHVAEGDLIVVLSNTSLQLDVISREAQVTEQLNNLRTIELALEQNSLSHRSNLVEINYQLVRLEREISRQQQLVENGFAPVSELERLQDEFAYMTARREITLESQATDAKLQVAQMIQLRASTEQLERNLVFARENLDALNVRAPVAGRVTAFDIEIGQFLSRGERMGQIDDPDNFKVTANIDEFYLSRVDIDQTAVITLRGTAYPLRVSKVYPQVRNGQFEVDFVYTEAQPENIRRGQTLQMQLQLGDPSPATLIPNGAFYQDTGGNWVFVVSADGDQAIKSTVRLGRRNVRYIEVLEGLEPGEQVITSPYTNFVDMDRLEISS